MATLDDKILDGPSVGYCSSDDEGDGDGLGMTNEGNGKIGSTSSAGEMSRTGPKGVLADYERFKRKEKVRKTIKEEEFNELANRFSLSHKPKDGEEEEVGEDELERIRRRRIEQLRSMAKGRILEVPGRLEFLSLIENESRNGCSLFMHIYSDRNEQSQQLNDALLELSGRLAPASAKFYKVQTKVLGTSEKFSRDALPALQVYRDEQLIGNFIRLNAELDDDYDGAELYKFLKRNDIPLELEDEMRGGS